MSGDALAVALDLLRAPALRSALRQRPLPADVGELIELAAGEPGRLARVAASRGEAPERVLEAARFYVREVLLFAGADAYRVLGVGPGASPEEIKLHHRHLQHWLHPDRGGNDWESAFATRINAAWSDLRSPERRAAYDVRQSSAAEGAGARTSPRRTRVNHWRPAPLHERHSVGWLVVGASAALWAWLVVLVERQAAAPAREWNPTRAEASTPASASATLAASFGAALADAGTLLQGESPADVAVPTRIDEEAGAPVPDPVRWNRQMPPSAPERPAPAPLRASPGNRRPAYTAWVADEEGEVAPASPPSAPRPRASIAASTGVAVGSAPADPEYIDPAVLVERVSLLRRRGNELLRYLDGTSATVPPLWRSVTAQDRAAVLHTRLGSARVRFAEPAWRISDDHASMTTRVQRAGTSEALRAEFAWRDGMWLVESLHTEELQ